MIKIIFYNNLYYVLGGFTTVNSVTRNRIVVLNLNGTVNTTESDKFILPNYSVTKAAQEVNANNIYFRHTYFSSWYVLYYIYNIFTLL